MPITIAGTGTITGLSAGGLPDGCITTDDLAAGAATPAKLSQPLTLGTAVATTSGTAIDFTGIPSWVKRVTVMFNGVSTNGTNDYLIQVGTSSGIVSSGYVSTGNAYNQTASTGGLSSTAGFAISVGSGAYALSGHMLLTTLGSNAWVSSHNLKSATNRVNTGGGDVTLSGTLTQVRLTTVGGTDTFDAGSVNIMYE